jgi:hypothetical protein
LPLLLVAGQDLVIGIQAIRQAHERRTLPRFWLRLAPMIRAGLPKALTWRELAEPYTTRPLLGSVILNSMHGDMMGRSRMTTLRIEHAITDYGLWKKAFDGFAEARTMAGVLSCSIRLPVDDLELSDA